MHADYTASPGIYVSNKFESRRWSPQEAALNQQHGQLSGPFTGLPTAISSLMSSMDEKTQGLNILIP